MLNEQQNKAVESDAKKILVLAGAGTGKTTTMLSRISRLINEGINASDILVLTFTNAAASEMKSRYKNDHLNHDSPVFCTFHAYCYMLIAKYPKVANELGYFNEIPTIADDAHINKIHNMCRLQCGTKLSQKILMGKPPNTPDAFFQYQIYWKQYNKLLRTENLITFDIMCYEVCKLFTSNNTLIEPEKKKYRYIFVDEFQDTDPRQWEFISSFKDSNLFVVGDAKQALYGFRGADDKIIKSLASDTEWETIKLTDNYRSTIEICNAANEVHKSWGDNPYNLNINSSIHGDQVNIHLFNNRSSYMNDILNNVISDCDKYHSVAVLCRTNAEVSEIQAIFKSKNIPYKTKDSKESYAEIYLKSAVDDVYMVDWLSSMLTSSEYSEYLKLSTIREEYRKEENFIKLYGTKFKTHLDMVFKLRSILNSEESALSKITEICGILKISKSLIPYHIEDVNTCILNIIQSIQKDKKPDNETLYIGTIHSVKGLEYDAVHILNVGGKYFPINKEHMNVFYVAITRAKKKLDIWKN